MSDVRRWVILSPHLDDAAFSCGGLAHALSRAHPVEVWTVFTAAPFRGPYSKTAQWLHSASGGLTGSRLARRRRAEDRDACRKLGVTCVHLGWKDAVYRRGPRGDFLYSDCRQNAIRDTDVALVSEISAAIRARMLDSDILLAPMGVGGHVDHLVARDSVQRLAATVLYYPELPYVMLDDARLADLTTRLLPVNYKLDAGDFAAWKAAVLCHRSQLGMLRSSAGGPVEIIERFASGGLLDLYAHRGVAASDLSPLPLFTMRASGRLLETEKLAPFGATAVVQATVPVVPEWADAPLAPVAVFAFRRLDLLRRTLRALEACDGFAESPVHVFSDGPRAGSPDDAMRVEELRAWAGRWCRRHGATLHESSGNRGLRASITSGVTSLLGDHPSVIVLEDDIVVSPAFIVFMNQGLRAYRDRDDIMHLSGHFVPHRERLKPVGLLRVPSSWGWGTWARAWRHYSDDAARLLAEIRKADVHAFNINGSYPYLDELARNASGELDTWAVRWYASMFLRNGLAAYPAKSFARNIGFGTDGTNCKPGPMARVYRNQPIRIRRVSPVWEDVLSESPAYVRAMEDFYRWQQAQWVKPSLSDRLRAFQARLLPRSSTG